jgi:hypothetical protein
MYKAMTSAAFVSKIQIITGHRLGRLFLSTMFKTICPLDLGFVAEAVIFYGRVQVVADPA